MYDRVKFEFNLPSTARQYLEELNEEYPRKSLPGYPSYTNNEIKCECVVMPRMVYDIWPYFVPHYPLYSNILYPAVSTVVEGYNSINASSWFLNSFNSTSSAPVYYRSVKSKPAVVDAESINKSIIGSMLTPDQLDEKIRQQIYNHRHLLKSSSKSREVSQERSSSREMTSNNCCCCQRSYCGSRSATPQCQREKEESEKCLNKYHEEYVRKIQDLYDSAKNECNCSCSSLRRSKSVTFSDDCSRSCCHSDYESQNEEEYEKHKRDNSKSINTEVSFSKKENKSKSKKVTNSSKWVPSRRHWRCYF